MSLAGNWKFTQHWNGMHPYSFPAQLNADGTIDVEGGYFGTWTQLGSSSQVALAIANFSQGTITSYNGNVVGGAMGGEMTGARQGGSVHQGNWSAVREAYADAEHQDGPRAPGE